MNCPCRPLLFIATCVAGGAVAAPAVPQAVSQTANVGHEAPVQAAGPSQTAGVDNDAMGPYRALAQLSYQAFQSGDLARAAELSRILERTWDHGEWHNQTERPAGSWCKSNHTACAQVDKAMDVYIGPLIQYAVKPPDSNAVQAAYKAFLEQLNKAG